MRGERLLIATTKKIATAMHRLLLLALLVLTGSYTAWAQQDGFRLHGCLPLPDGTAVGLLVSTDTAQSVECSSGVRRAPQPYLLIYREDRQATRGYLHHQQPQYRGKEPLA